MAGWGLRVMIYEQEMAVEARSSGKGFFLARESEMKRTWVYAKVLPFFVCVTLFGLNVAAPALEEGEITGTIERLNQAFLREYEELDYGSEKEWKDWAKGLKSLGWIVVRGDSGEPKDHLLLVIDTRTEMVCRDSETCRITDLESGSRIWAKYKMGWDALHAIHVKKLGE